MKILIVEDDAKIASFLKQGLEEELFCVDVCDNGRDALYLSDVNTYDLMILDLMLKGDLTGDEICHKIREKKSNMPIIVLSARSTIGDKVSLLNLGADDYVTKPFSFDELVARIHVQWRKNDAKELLLSIADLHVNPMTKTVMRAGEIIALTAREYNLLEYLLRHKGAMIDENTLHDQLFNHEQHTSSNIISVYMYRLRNKIDKNHSLKLIKTYRNLGYSINENTL